MKPIPSYSAFARLLALGVLLALGTQAFAQTDPLPSWNDGPAKQAILAFVKDTTDQASPKFVPPAERIATFDQDGTLWVSHPMYTQVMYVLESVPALVKAKPELAKVAPFSTVLEILKGDRAAIAKLTMPDLEKLVAATSTGMSVETFQAEVKKWIAEARDSRWKKPYTELTYLPMQEVLKYLRANGYQTYIVTGGGQDFVRVYSEATYGIPPEQVVGTAGGTKYGYDKALFNAGEALSAMLGWLLDENKPVPAPSPAGEGMYLIAPDARTQAALLIRRARGDRSLAELARALETSWPSAQRLENPRHSPTLRQLEKAAALGKRLVLALE